MSVFSALVLSLSLSFSSPVTGVVVDSANRPIPRASIEVIARDGSPAGTVFTDADGTFRRAVGAGRVPRCARRWPGFSRHPPTAAPTRPSSSRSRSRRSRSTSSCRRRGPKRRPGQVASAVTVFDAAQLEGRQEPPLADLLRQAPGSTVVRVGAPGSVTSLFVRGGESNYTKVLLDGIPLNEPGGAFNMSNITTENLDRVEFIRGANSAVYGSDAMTGVLQLFTRRGESPRPEVRVRFEGGSFSSARGSAGISAKTGTRRLLGRRRRV